MMPNAAHDVAADVPQPGLAVLIVFGPDELVPLETTIRGLAEHCVQSRIHVRLAARGLADDALAELRRIGGALDGRHEWSVISVATDAGFAALLRGVADAHPERDVALIAPGAILPFAWDARLAKAAHAETDIAAAIPLCDVSPLFALVDEKFRGSDAANPAHVDRSAYSIGDRRYYDVPGLHPVCAYLRRAALDAALPLVTTDSTGPQAMLDALAAHWRATGSASVIVDYVYVGYAGRTLASTPRLDFDQNAFLRDSPLGGLRRAVNEAIERGLPPVSTPGLDARPVQLHIMHFWGGGLERWVRDFGRADPKRINMILATYRIGETGGQRIVLYSDPASRAPVRTWDIARPIRSTDASSLEYRRILAQILDEFDVEAIIVSSLIGHALDALTQPRKTLVVCHDFYPVCQAINPRFGTPCVRCTPDDLRRCAQSNPLNEFFDDRSSEEWDLLRERYVALLHERGIEMVVPSPSVGTTLRLLAPRLADVPMHVIPHGTDPLGPRLPIAMRTAEEPLRIVVLGRMSVRKGADLLRAAAPALAGLADITLVGGGPDGVALAQECGFTCIERYDQDALPGILRGIAPHAGLLASIVPESFSYTLSELQQLGVPPLVTDLGAFKDRVAHGENGFRFETDRDALVALVRLLHDQPELLETVARHLAEQPPGRTSADMVDEYRALVPLGARPVARFRIGIGTQTGLSEPYRQLTAAYAELTEAYGQSAKAYADTKEAYAQSVAAYEHTRAAYEKANSDLGGLRAAYKRFAQELGALNVMTHPWRARRALIAFRDEAAALGRSVPAAAPGDDAKK
jgi:glycosyltransferase involved in cell wall biosynthesis